jgi:hypothetical protein
VLGAELLGSLTTAPGIQPVMALQQAAMPSAILKDDLKIVAGMFPSAF